MGATPVAQPDFTALQGSTDDQGSAFDPTSDAPEAVATVQDPRPTQSRLPISADDFLSLKSGASGYAIPSRPDAQILADASAAGAAGGAAATMMAAPAAAAPARSLRLATAGFAGFGPTGMIPYDCALAVGPNHVVAAVNSNVMGTDLNGTTLFAKTLATWFSAVLQNATLFDPKLLFDQEQQRFVLVASAYRKSDQKSWFAISVSQSADPTASWWSYAIDASGEGATPTAFWADYPALGQDSNALYIAANMFAWGNDPDPFKYAKLRVIPKAATYAGRAFTYYDFINLTNNNGTKAFAVQPAVTVGASSHGYAVNSVFPTAANSVSSDISLWDVDSSAATPTLSFSNVAASAYSIPPHADQPSGEMQLDTGDTRIQACHARDGSIWASLPTNHAWDTGGNVTAVYWFQIDSNSKAMLQQGIYGAPSRHYFYPALAPDGSGGAALVFSRSDSGTFAEVASSGRASADPAGTLGGSTVVQAGTATYRSVDSFGRNRWGDYSAIGADAADPAAVWVTGGYVSSANNWSTWIVKTT